MRYPRLTDAGATPEGTTLGMPKLRNCYWKLKEYEDAEETVGFNLPSLLRAVDGGFWYKDKGGEVRFTGDDRVYYSQGELYVYATDTWLKLSDYGTKWAFVRMVLE